MIDYERLDAIAKEQMLHRKAHLKRERGFIYHHCKRTAKSVILLREMATEDASHDDALRIAAMFHDLGKGIEPHDVTGAVLAQALLEGVVPGPLLDEVTRLIRMHKNWKVDDLYANLLQDADVMDHFGAIEVGISFQYGAYTEKGMEETLAWYRDEFPAYAERIRKQLHFDFSRAIYEEKVAFTVEFGKRFFVEMEGGYV